MIFFISLKTAQILLKNIYTVKCYYNKVMWITVTTAWCILRLQVNKLQTANKQGPPAWGLDKGLTTSYHKENSL
jgi:hypothetical protein